MKTKKELINYLKELKQDIESTKTQLNKDISFDEWKSYDAELTELENKTEVVEWILK